MRLDKRIVLLLALALLVFLALGPLWPLTSFIPERGWWILLVLIGLALAWPRGLWEEGSQEATKPRKNFHKKVRLLAYLRAAEKSKTAKERLAEMLLELAVGILALKKGMEEEKAWREIRSGHWPKDKNFWRTIHAEEQGENFIRAFSCALEALERELG